MRQRPDMAFNRFCEAAVRGEPITIYGDGKQTLEEGLRAEYEWMAERAGDRDLIAG